MKTRYADYGVVGDSFLTPDGDVVVLKNLTDSKAVFLKRNDVPMVRDLSFLERCRKLKDSEIEKLLESKKWSLMSDEKARFSRAADKWRMANRRKQKYPDDPFSDEFLPYTSQQQAEMDRMTADHAATMAEIEELYTDGILARFDGGVR